MAVTTVELTPTHSAFDGSRKVMLVAIGALSRMVLKRMEYSHGRLSLVSVSLCVVYSYETIFYNSVDLVYTILVL